MTKCQVDFQATGVNTADVVENGVCGGGQMDFQVTGVNTADAVKNGVCSGVPSKFLGN